MSQPAGFNTWALVLNHKHLNLQNTDHCVSEMVKWCNHFKLTFAQVHYVGFDETELASMIASLRHTVDQIVVATASVPEMQETSKAMSIRALGTAFDATMVQEQQPDGPRAMIRLNGPNGLQFLDFRKWCGYSKHIPDSVRHLCRMRPNPTRPVSPGSVGPLDKPSGLFMSLVKSAAVIDGRPTEFSESLIEYINEVCRIPSPPEYMAEFKFLIPYSPSFDNRLVHQFNAEHACSGITVRMLSIEDQGRQALMLARGPRDGRVENLYPRLIWAAQKMQQ